MSVLRQNAKMNQLVREHQILMLLFINMIGYFAIFIVQPYVPQFLSNMMFGGVNAYPLSFQMFMWCPFFVGIHSVIQRYSFHKSVRKFADRIIFPIKETTILGTQHFMMMLDMVRPMVHREAAIAPRILQQVILKYQASKSAEQASSMLNNLLELARQRLDVAYASLRYISWLIPSLGFMGTVYGISITVAEVGVSSPEDPTLLSKIASNLAVAFDTTLLALIQSSILVLVMSLLQGKEEDSINSTGEYVLENVINRLE